MADGRSVIETNRTRRLVREYDVDGRLLRILILPVSKPTPLPPEPKPAPTAEPAPAAPSRGPRLSFRKAPAPPAPEVAAPPALKAEPVSPPAPEVDHRLPVVLEPYDEPEPPALEALVVPLPDEPEPVPLQQEIERDALAVEATAFFEHPPEPPAVAPEPPVAAPPPRRFAILAVEPVAPLAPVAPPTPAAAPEPVAEPEPIPAPARVPETPPEPIVIVDDGPPAPPPPAPEPPAVEAPQPVAVVEREQPVAVVEPEQPAPEPQPEPAPGPRRYHVEDLETRVDAAIHRGREPKKRRPRIPVPEFEPLRREPWEERLDAALEKRKA